MSGKLSELADRIKRTRLEHEAEADRISATMAKVDDLATKAFAHAEHVTTNMHADARGMLDELVQLSNLPPLEESKGS